MAITDEFQLVDLDYYAENGPPYALWDQLRAESPVHWCDFGQIEPFWAITRQEEIKEISRTPDVFLSEPGVTLMPRVPVIQDGEGIGAMKVVIVTDPPVHRDLRKVVSPSLTPRALKRMQGVIAESAKSLVDELAREGEADLAMGLAVSHPLRILSKALGVPEEQEPQVLELSNRLFAPEDLELGGGRTSPEDFAQLGQEFLELFLPIVEDRRKNPRDDIASIIANARINGEPMGPMETLGYYLIIFSAGHDTTKNSLAGGFAQLIQNPDEFDKVKADLSRASDAVEEMIRWSSPVNYMKRTAARDTVVNGQAIREGDSLVLFYGSANRDESVFDAPYQFSIDRNPNRHIAFGYGEHFCMGTHFARQSMRSVVEELARRVEYWEFAAEPEWIRANFVVGLKHLHVRYKIRDS
ncbi:MAG: cytochrome P450 [Myxococcota bacterium]|jgi:cytochrome P450|nr:cytochrome P450 [Myxococcota bacterium]